MRPTLEPQIGDRFQKDTAYHRGQLPAGRLDWTARPAPYKTYSGVPRMALSAPLTEGGAPVWDTLRRRRSVRHYSGGSLPEAALSQLLWAAQGITAARGGYHLRTAPSAGALYPIETYIVLHGVAGLAAGIYHYVPIAHELEVLRLGDFRNAIARAALDQRFVAQANVVFVWTAVFARTTWKYSQRGYRYVYLDAGHIAQNLALAAVALGLGSCPIAALYEDEVNALLGVDGEEESTIYMAAVGNPAVP